MFVVIDGSALMCVSYYGNLPLEVKAAKTEEEKEQYYHLIEQTKAGVYTNGIKGFLNTLMNIMEQQKPEYIAVCFDEARESTFRRRLYPDYKGQRSASPDPLKRQMVNIRTILQAVGVPVLMSKEYEADDYAGSLVRQFEGPNMPVRFLTKDRDYLQLLSPYTKGWMMTSSEAKAEELSAKYGYQSDVPFGCYEFDESVLFGEYGLTPAQVVDWKGISGDASDNIPGVKGVSDKSAIPLLQKYGDMEGIYAALEACKTEEDETNLKKSWKEELGIFRPPLAALKDYKMQGFMSRFLAEIKTDLPVGDVEDYKADINYDKLAALATRLELTDFVNRLSSFEGKEEEDYERCS